MGEQKPRPPRIYSYILKVDGGHAPNPFFGWLTLACCKPRIRRTAKEGDWVVGITPKPDGHRLAYARDEALVAEIAARLRRRLTGRHAFPRNFTRTQCAQSVDCDG